MPPACSMVRTTCTAGIFSPLMTLSSTGMPRPSSTTVIELSTWMVTSIRVAWPRQRLVDRVVDDLIDQVMQSLLAGRADIHGRAQAHGRQAFENRNVFSRIPATLFVWVLRLLRLVAVPKGRFRWG